MFRLTLSGRLFLGLIVVLQLASITSQSGLLVWLVGLLFACLLVNAFAAAITVRGLRLEPPSRILVQEGAAPTEAWKLRNSGRFAARLVTVEHDGREWLRVAAAPGKQTVAAQPKKISARRGVFSLEEAVVSTVFPFGLVKFSRAAGAAGEALVFPKLPEVDAPEVRGLDVMFGGGHVGKGRVASGTAFAGVRPAVAGDSFRQIHWKSSAKGRGLMVKTFDEELAGRAAIAVACEAGPHAEERLRFAGGLALAGLDAGHHITWINLATGKRVDLDPFGDDSALLEELARFKFADELKVVDVSSIPKRSAVHVVASRESSIVSETAEHFRATGREVWVHLPKK